MIKRIKIFYLWFENKFEPLFSFIDRIEKHHLFLISGGIAFNIILYLIPLLLVGVYLVNIFMGADVISSRLSEYIETVLPPNESTNQLLQTIVHEVSIIFNKSSIVGWVGIFILLWLSSTLLSSLRAGLNTIFDIETPHVFVFYKIKDVFLVFSLMFLFIISSYLLPMFSIVQQIITENVKPPYQWYFTKMFLSGVTLVTSFLMFFGVFKFLPNAKIPNIIVISSTILSVILIEFSRNIFAWYIVQFGTYGKFYGTYAVLVSVAVWIYYMVLIMLLSAELSRFLYERYENYRKNQRQKQESEKEEIQELSN